MAAAAPASASVSSNSGDRVFASPLAVRLAEEKGLDINSISGTGPNGRVLAADVEEFKAQPVAAAAAAAPKAKAKAASSGAMADLPSTAGAYEDFENSQIRKVIAERLTYSK